MISENGLGEPEELAADGTVDDSPRIEYMTLHLQQLQLALTDGVEIFAYCPWSALMYTVSA